MIIIIFFIIIVLISFVIIIILLPPIKYDLLSFIIIVIFAIIFFVSFVIIFIMFVMLQTILRMHEREEKMKERLMDLRLKSEEQVLKILKIFKILKILKIFKILKILKILKIPKILKVDFFSDQHHLLIHVGSLPVGEGSRGTTWTTWVTKGQQSRQQVGFNYDQVDGHNDHDDTFLKERILMKTF